MSALGNGHSGRGGNRGSRGKRASRARWSLHTKPSKKSKPLEMFPRTLLPSQSLPSDYETAIVKEQLSFHSGMRSSPLFMHSSSSWKPNVLRTNAAARFEPFESIRTRSRRPRSTTQVLPRFNKQAHPLRLYPRELRAVVDKKSQQSTRQRKITTRMDNDRTMDKLDEQLQQRSEDFTDQEDDALEGSDNGDEDSQKRRGIDLGENVDEEDDLGRDSGAEQFFNSEEDDVDDVTMGVETGRNETIEDEYE